ncbi:hypothetical protein GOM49_06520 [Clostridium bovifaecis]|uniref:Uncharacterized protein n=1 Tax=Clostridium bovifaecis TaxID=2184719 RepID=A0A6I6EV53_9CLOT|nr:hypothetical protein GOM49_06520 [Clostridium bovifaecis]
MITFNITHENNGIVYGAGDRSEIVEFKGYRHVPMIDNADKFISVIIDFMERQPLLLRDNNNLIVIYFRIKMI